MLEEISDLNILPECFCGPLKTLCRATFGRYLPTPWLQYFRTEPGHIVLPLCCIHYALVLSGVARLSAARGRLWKCRPFQPSN